MPRTKAKGAKPKRSAQTQTPERCSYPTRAEDSVGWGFCDMVLSVDPERMRHVFDRFLPCDNETLFRELRHEAWFLTRLDNRLNDDRIAKLPTICNGAQSIADLIKHVDSNLEIYSDGQESIFADVTWETTLLIVGNLLAAGKIDSSLGSTIAAIDDATPLRARLLRLRILLLGKVTPPPAAVAIATLSRNAEVVLDLLNRHAGVSLTAIDMEAKLTATRDRISRSLIADACRELKGAGYVEQCFGERKGWSVTPAGAERIKQLTH